MTLLCIIGLGWFGLAALFVGALMAAAKRPTPMPTAEMGTLREAA